MILRHLLNKTNIDTYLIQETLLNKVVCGITTNSLLVKSDYIFIAVKGNNTNGHLYLKNALKKGALIVFVQKDNSDLVKSILSEDDLNRVIIVENTKSIINILSKTFYSNLPNNIIAVTGTNGKTSVSCMVVQMLSYLGVNNAQIGTLGVFFNGIKQPLSKGLTTPVGEDIFSILSIAKQNCIDYTIIESSSEGIDQGRVSLLPIKIAAFTNLSQDHLNYHKNMENYFMSKSKLFIDVLKDKGIAIINVDDPYGKRLISICKKYNIMTLTYGESGVNLILINKKLVDTGYNISLLYKDVIYNVELNLLGDFQIYNLLCALLIVLSLEITNIKKLLEAVNNINNIPGRLELVKIYNGARVFIDYAHTPDALYRALKTLKGITKNKLYVVFGCGGNRDSSKRKQMGDIASKLADFSYITDDNPRYEDAESIRNEIILGFNTNNYLNIGNREQAIVYAMKLLKEGDVLLVAGKGHEEVQIIKDKVIDYSDKKVILNVKV